VEVNCRAFAATRPNTKRAGDVTFAPTGEGWMHLAVAKDAERQAALPVHSMPLP